MRIEALHLKNFRCLTDFQITFDKQLTVLVGVNGAGKTTVLDALAIFLNDIVAQLNQNNTLTAGFFTISSENLSTMEGVNSLYYALSIWPLPEPTTSSNMATHENSLKLEWNFQHNTLKNANLKIINNPTDRVYKSDMLTRLLEDFHKNAHKDGFPVFCYYGSKRLLSKEVNQYSPVKLDATSAFANAFTPNIDFATSLAWFDSKDAEEARKRRERPDYESTELKAVRDAISQALGEYELPHMDETPAQLFIYKKINKPNSQRQRYKVEQLSDGYKTMLALVMDLARRMAAANSEFINANRPILDSCGIVLIDEIELHLHPSWQQNVLPTLMKIFPNIQFIVTTHSPQVLSSVKTENIRILSNGELIPVLASSYGAQSSRLLEDIFDVPPRPNNEAKRSLNKYFELINDGKGKTPEAVKLREQLDGWLNEDPDLDKADMLIARKERLTQSKG